MPCVRRGSWAFMRDATKSRTQEIRMNNRIAKAKSIFAQAVENIDPDKWDTFVEQACGSDQELIAEVKALLKGHLASHELLDGGIQSCDEPTVDESNKSFISGQHVGPYKLLELIGEGGMGNVFMAEQLEPVKRRVAVKIVKPGMDSKLVITRFEAERQALAMMDHPNIAKVLDAGTFDARPAQLATNRTTKSSPPPKVIADSAFQRPYFVMELVKGIPITEFCDQHRLSLHHRLELFIPVCQAVQHAHQKGIIHRDIKPSNVLVAMYDDRPVPKIIDFGVAKAINQTLTEKTMFTQFGQILGTFEYMSPEQAKFNQLDIDTRSDIYSLGVLLYELLTGSPPFDKTRLRSAAFDEVVRIIREEEPPAPSTKINTSQKLDVIAANRNAEPGRLSGLVRGELDWIVLKAVEKDRARRYESASQFSNDIKSFLNDQPVSARPATFAYRARKFIRRKKGLVAAVTLMGLILLAGIVGSTTGWIRAIDASQAARSDANRAREAEQLAINQRSKNRSSLKTKGSGSAPAGE